MTFKFYVETDNILFEHIREYLYEKYDILNTKNTGIFKDNIKTFGLTTTRHHISLKYGISFGVYKISFNNIPIIVDYNIEGNTRGCADNVQYYKRIILSSSSEQTIKDLIDNIFKEKNKTLSDGKINIFVPETSGDWIKYQEIPKRTLNSIYINEKSKNKIMSDLKNFIKNENEYNVFGIPYKRTYLFTGPPGSGKTSFIKAICNELDYNLSILSLNKKFDDGAFMWAMSSIKENSLLLVEDIDCLFEKRTNGSSNIPITFSNFLNILDGVLYKHGCIMFLTTNHPEKLDHALLRIGRVDCILEFDFPKKAEIKKLFFDITKSTEDEFNKFYDCIKGKKLPMAALVNFLFLNKNTWEITINELINTNDFIKKVLKTDVEAELYN